MPEEIVHRFINKLVGNRFFGLVFIGGLGGKAGGHKPQAVLHIRKRDLALPLGIFARVFDIAVDHVNKRELDRALGGAAIFQPTGIVVVFGPFFTV